ncbi:MAG: hypothetical protein H0V48_06995 [Nocardioidaceae bacterium]|nr:hypothetical protein [Nocardioidaceae bacterium]
MPRHPSRGEQDPGALLPDVTRDETAESWGESPEDRDDELRREVPPHHG